jgi:hypothetical protein
MIAEQTMAVQNGGSGAATGMHAAAGMLSPVALLIWLAG